MIFIIPNVKRITHCSTHRDPKVLTLVSRARVSCRSSREKEEKNELPFGSKP
jgi:hypothetical protein